MNPLEKKKEPERNAGQENPLMLGGINLDRIKDVFAEDLSKFFAEHYELWVIIGVFVILFATLMVTQSFRDSSKHVSDSLSALVKAHEAEFQVEYPQGFKVIVIDGEKIIQTHDDTLSKIFKINWREARVLSNDGYEIKLFLPSLTYRPNKISLNNVQATIYAKPEAVTSLVSANAVDLFIRILNVQNDRILCVVAFKNIEDSSQ